METPPFAAIDIGSSRITALAGEVGDDGKMHVTAKSELPSSGIRNGCVVNMGYAMREAGKALSALSENAGIEIGKVYASVGGGCVASKRFSRTKAVDSPEGVVLPEDVDYLKQDACGFPVEDGKKTIHCFPLKYRLDSQNQIDDPAGLKGSTLSLEFLAVSGDENHFGNMEKILAGNSVDLGAIAFSALAAGLSVLSREMKEAGTLLVDLGEGTTSYALYCGAKPLLFGSLPFGASLVTSDIKQAFNLSHRRAEEIKRQYACATISSAKERIRVDGDLGRSGKTISPKSLSLVTNARMEEIFGFVRKAVERESLLKCLDYGVVLTGRGASLNGICDCAGSVFNLNCETGRPLNVRGLECESEPHGYAVSSGLLLFGHEMWKAQKPRKRLFGIFG